MMLLEPRRLLSFWSLSSTIGRRAIAGLAHKDVRRAGDFPEERRGLFLAGSYPSSRVTDRPHNYIHPRNLDNSGLCDFRHRDVFRFDFQSYDATFQFNIDAHQ